MANIASEARPAITGGLGEVRPGLVAVLMLVMFALVPWQHGPRRVIVSLDEVKRPPVIVPMDVEQPGFITQLADVLGRSLHVSLSFPATSPLADSFLPSYGASVIVPARHPDAEVWPRGMVIHPPPFADNMPGRVPTHPPAPDNIPAALDRLLSGLVAAYLPAAS